MKRRLLFFFLLVSSFAFAQNNIYRSGGITQTIGAPTFTPGASGNIVAIDTVTGEWYVNPNRLSGASWISAGYRLTNISGSVPPAYTPTAHQSHFVINAANQIYYWDGSAWQSVGGGSSGDATRLKFLVVNKSGATINKGEVVYVSGAQGNRVAVKKALATADSLSANTLGVADETIANNAEGYCVAEGVVSGLNTSSFTEGAALYLSPTTAGAITQTKPTAPNHLVLIGYCVKSNNGSGEISVHIDNGYEIGELHDVYVPSPSNGQVLTYDSTDKRWEAATVADQSNTNEGVLGVSAGSATTSVITSNTDGATGVTLSAGTGISVSETTASNGGTITVTNSAPDQTVSITNGGGITPSGTYPNFTLTAADQSATNEIQTIDTFSLSGQTLRASLSNDNQPAKTVTLPVVGITAGTNVTVSEAAGVYTINSTGGGGGGGGITSLNGLTASNQTFATGTTGTDFNIASATSTHTFNFPTASATNRGALSSADWSTFNGKVGGSGTSGQVSYWNGTSTQTGSSNLAWDNTINKLSIAGSSANANITIKATTDGADIGATEQSSAYTPGANWSGSGLTWTHSVGSIETLTASLANNTGAAYRFTATVTGRTAGSFSVSFKGNTVSSITSSRTSYLPHISTANIVITPTSDFNGTVTFSFVFVSEQITPAINIDNQSGASTVEIKSAGQTNLCLGYKSAATIVGVGVTSIGSESGRKSLGSEWTAIGYQAAQSSTTANRWTAIGCQAAQSSTTGSNWLAIGYKSGASNITGGNWTAIGTESATSNSSGGFFNAIGFQAAYSNTSGNFFNAMGYQSARLNTSGSNFNAIGHQAGISNTTGSGWSALGSRAGGSNTTGSEWTAIGSDAAYFSSDGTTPSQFFQNSVYIGSQSRATNGTSGALTTNEVAIGYQSVGQGSNTVAIGNSSTIKSWIGGSLVVGTTESAQARLHARGSNTSSGTNAFLVQNSTPDDIHKIENNGRISYWATNTATGTTGAQTINRPSGTVNFAAGASALVVTNSLVATTSIVFAVVRTNDSTAYVKNVVPAAGSFTINLGAAATAETSVGWWVIN